jgi:hypothetical protein
MMNISHCNTKILTGLFLGIQKTFLCETIKNKFYSGLIAAEILKEIAVLLE